MARIKPPEAIPGMSKKLARKKFNEQCDLKMDLCRQLRKCERDIMKYYLTMTK